MELKDYVRKTLVQIVQGVAEAQTEVGPLRNASMKNVTEEVTLAQIRMLPNDLPQTCYFLVNGIT